MTVVVYADLIFLLNGCVDFLLLWLTSGIRRQMISKWRLFFASVIGGIYSALYLWSAFGVAFLLPIKILVSLVMIWVAFGMHHPLSYFRNLFVFYLVCFLTGGAMLAMHYLFTGDSNVFSGSLFATSGGWGSPVSWLFIVIGFPLVWLYCKFSFQSLEERKGIHQHLALVQIDVAGTITECMGLVDTGNQLRDPITRAPIIMIELKKIEEWIPIELKRVLLGGDFSHLSENLPMSWVKRIRIIPYRATGTKGNLLIAFKPDVVKILQQKEWHTVDKVLIGIDVGCVSSDGAFQAIIHPSCLTVVS